MKKALLPFLAVAAIGTGAVIANLYAGAPAPTVVETSCGVLEETEWNYFDCTVEQTEATELNFTIDGHDFTLNTDENVIYHNDGTGTYEDVTVAASAPGLEVADDVNVAVVTDSEGTQFVVPFLF